MKKILFAAMLLSMTACRTKTGTPALDLSNLDPNVSPSESFYQYATGGWQAKNPLKPEYSRYGSFDVLRENNEKRLSDLFDAMGKATPAKGTVEQKISDLYKMGLDSVRLNKEGAEPVKADLAEINALSDRAQLTPLLSRMHMRGLSPLMSLGIEADLKNSKSNALYAGQEGIGMGNRDYYLDAENETIRAAYRTYLGRLFTLAGYDAEQSAKGVEAVMRIETELARAMRSNVELRDLSRAYNPLTMEEFAKRYDAIDFVTFFQAAGIHTDRVIVAQPEFLDAMNALVKREDMPSLRAYLAAQYLSGAAGYLSDDFFNASFDFYGRTLSGQPEPRARWKRSMGVADGALGEAVGKIYVEKYFPASDKERMLGIVKNLQTALGQHIEKLDWMSDSTKMRAQEKLAAFHVKIGYPDKWKDYASLEVDPKLSYWENVQRANEWSVRDQLAKLSKPVDIDEWHMTPQTVNAYYNPTTNEICFPAAILQPPFYNSAADDAVNYGAIGVVIGHEMTHGFDDQGRHFDAVGNMNNWWTAADEAAFAKKTEILVKQFDAIEVLPARDGQPALHANGSLSLGENIADQGGLRVAMTALRNSFNGVEPKAIDDLSPEKRFYLAYAALWGQNIREAEIARLTKLDVHSLGQWRVDATLRNIAEFYKAFDITSGKMFLPEEQRVVIW